MLLGSTPLFGVGSGGSSRLQKAPGQIIGDGWCEIGERLGWAHWSWESYFVLLLWFDSQLSFLQSPLWTFTPSSQTPACFHHLGKTSLSSWISVAHKTTHPWDGPLLVNGYGRGIIFKISNFTLFGWECERLVFEFSLEFSLFNSNKFFQIQSFSNTTSRNS